MPREKLLIWAAVTGSVPEEEEHLGNASRLPLKIELGILAAIVGIAALLRFLSLDTVPAGWHHDEALMGVMASEVFRGVQRPIFFPAYLGQEPLYIYLAAGMMWLMGGNQDILPLRATSAALGIATVLATFLMGREMFGRRVGLIGAAVAGTSFWQVMLGRGGCRVIAQPLLEGLTVFFVWRAFRRQSVLWAIAAGLACGGTIYTYLGARVFPAVLAAFGLWWLVVRGLPPIVDRLRLGVFLGLSVLTAAPLLLYFAGNPGTFFPRINQVSVFQNSATAQEPLRALAENVVKLFGTFTVHGETLWRYNIPGRPIMVGLIGVLFYVGLLVTCRDAWRRRPAATLILIWLVVMMVPSVLTYDVGGYTFRSMGLVPALYLLPALGLVALWDWLTRQAPPIWQRGLQYAFVILTVTTLLLDAGLTYRDYFTVWAGSFGAAYENMEDVVAAARFLDRAARPGEEEIFVSSDYYPHPVIAHLTPRVYPSARWFDGNSTMVVPGSAVRDSLFVFPYSARPAHLADYLPDAAIVERQSFPDGPAKLVAYRLTAAEATATARRIATDPGLTRVDRDLGGVIALLGYRTERRVVEGDTLVITAVWRILQGGGDGEYAIFAHLLDQQGQMVAQDDTTAFPSQEWRAGDVVQAEHRLKLGRGVGVGKYGVELGAYDKATMQRLAVGGAAGDEDTLPLGAVKVARSERANDAPPPPAQALSVRLDEGIVCEGFDLRRTDGTAESRLEFALHWRALGTPREDYTAFVQLLSPDGRLVAQSDGQPDGGRLPTSFWEQGDWVVDRHGLSVSGGLPAGRYTVIAGLYQLSSGRRLPVEGGGDHFVLTAIDLPGAANAGR